MLGNDSRNYRWQWVSIDGTKRAQEDEAGQEWAVFSGEALAVVTGNGTSPLVQAVLPQLLVALRRRST